MHILDILDEIASNQSTKFKQSKLEQHRDNGSLQRVIKATYDPYLNYYIRQIPEYKQIGSTDIGLEEAINQLGLLSNRTKTGNAGIEHLRQILCNLSPKSAEVIARIIDRDLKAGFSDTTANKVWPGLVPTFDVMLSHKDISGIKFPAYCQNKFDGMRVHLHKDVVGNLTAFSRNGKEIMLHGVLNESARIISLNETWDGELLCMRDGKVLSRQEGNGILNSAIRGTITPEEAEMIRFRVWDIVDFTSTQPYKERYTRLERRFDILFQTMFDTKILLTHNDIVNNEEEILPILEKAWADGEEGLIIKNIDSLWVPKRSKDLGKIKKVEEADLIIVDMIEGSNKYQGMLGALVCETADGLLSVNVGTGFSDEQRVQIWNWKNDLIGKVVTVKYNEIISNKGDNIKSLFLPRFVETRLDKNTANSLGELK